MTARFCTTFTAILLVACANTALARGVPDLDHCEAQTAAGEQVSLPNSPGGSGFQLTSAFVFGGDQTDATVTVTLRDSNIDPVVGFAAEDLWLDTGSGNLALCENGTIADGPTDSSGETTFTGPFRAGGASDYDANELLVVFIDAEPLTSHGLDILFNSPDLNQDGKVDCLDYALFEDIVSGDYEYRADYNFDGIINLADASLFVQLYGGGCTGEPDLIHSAAESAESQQVSVMTTPDGDGDPLSYCYLSGGTRTDATVTVTLRDSDDAPVQNYAAEDVWLATEFGGLAICPGGTSADGPSDEDGVMTLTGPFEGGGQSNPVDDEHTLVYVAGCAMTSPALDILFNSPDINGDNIVDEEDELLFNDDLIGDYNYRSDFNFDGIINLSDLIILANHFGATCWAVDVDDTRRRLALHPNAPNPFNPTTTIRYEVPISGPVELAVYDVVGRLVKVLIDEPQLAPGQYEIVWRGDDRQGRPVASGVYLYQLETESGRLSRRMLLVR